MPYMYPVNESHIYPSWPNSLIAYIIEFLINNLLFHQLLIHCCYQFCNYESLREAIGKIWLLVDSPAVLGQLEAPHPTSPSIPQHITSYVYKTGMTKQLDDQPVAMMRADLDLAAGTLIAQNLVHPHPEPRQEGGGSPIPHEIGHCLACCLSPMVSPTGKPSSFSIPD